MKDKTLSDKIVDNTNYGDSDKADFVFVGDVKDFIQKLKENQEKLKKALSRFADINRKNGMPLIDGDVYLFGKIVDEYLEIDKLAGDALI